MIELGLIYQGLGHFVAAAKHDTVTAEAQLETGDRVRARLTRPRSIEQHRWTFSLFQAAFDNQRGGPKVENWEQLRKWLLIQAGHCDVMAFEPGALTPHVAQWLRGKFGIEFTHDRKWIYAKVAKSISFRAVDSDEMTRIANAVVDVICEVIVPGTSRADWEPHLPGATEHGRTAKKPRARQSVALRDATSDKD